MQWSRTRWIQYGVEDVVASWRHLADCCWSNFIRALSAVSGLSSRSTLSISLSKNVRSLMFFPFLEKRERERERERESIITVSSASRLFPCRGDYATPWRFSLSSARPKRWTVRLSKSACPFIKMPQSPHLNRPNLLWKCLSISISFFFSYSSSFLLISILFLTYPPPTPSASASSGWFITVKIINTLIR